jgi:hypothetical protein
MTVLWLIFWLVSATPPVWADHHPGLPLSGSGAGLTAWGIAGAICLVLDIFTGKRVMD